MNSPSSRSNRALRAPRTRALALAAAAAVALLVAGCGGGGAATGSGSGTAAEGGGSGSGAIPGATSLPASLKDAPAPRIALPDVRGGTLDTRSLAGKPYLVTFLYAHCPDVCPLIADEIRQGVAGLGSRASDVATVAVSVDPEHDKPAYVREFLRSHRAPASFHYLVGTRKQLQPVWKDWFAAPQIPGDPDSSHTAAIWIVDARGRIAGKLSAGVAFDPAILTRALGQLLERA